MLTEKAKTSLAIVAAILVAIGIADYSSGRMRNEKLPAVARAGFLVFFTAGTACDFMWVYYGLRAKSKRKPGVSWIAANHALDFPSASVHYTEDGIRFLRKGRNCFLAWLALWAIATAILVAYGGFR